MKKLILTLAMTFALATMSSVSQVPGYVPADHLVAWWPLDGDATDATGNGWDGVVSGVTSTANRRGDAGSAMLFNGQTQPGTNNTVVLVDNSIRVPDFNVVFGASMTVSAWISGSSVSNADFIHRRNQNNIDFVCGGVPFNGPTGTHCGFFRVGTDYIYGPSRLASDEWHHYTYVYDGEFLRVYVDGQLDATTTATAGVPNNSATLMFGKYVYYGGLTHFFFFNGKMDDVGIWNRALTQSEVTQLFLGCDPSLLSPSVTGKSSVNVDSRAWYEVVGGEGNTFLWTKPELGQIESDPTSDRIRVRWVGTGVNELTVAETDALTGCSALVSLEVTVSADNGGGKGNRGGKGKGHLNEAVAEATELVGTVYPIPASDVLTLSLNVEGVVDVTIIDQQGRAVLSQQLVDQSTGQSAAINVAAILPGTYWLRVASEHRIETLPIIIIR